MNQEEEIQELTPGKRLACNLSAALVVVAAGLFLLLCGMGVFPIRVPKALCGTLLCAVGLMFILNAVISRNSVSLWLGMCFLVPALVELLVKTTNAGYRNLYPLYIAIPAVASVATMLFTHEWMTHLPVILLFGVPAGIFALKAGNAAGWSVVLPVLVIYVGLLMVIMAIRAKKKDNEDEF